MISSFLVGIFGVAVLFMGVFSFFAMVSYKNYRMYSLRIFLIKSSLFIVLTAYMFLTLLGAIITIAFFSRILFSISIVLINAGSIIAFIYFRYLRREKIGNMIFFLVALLLLKIITIIMHPIRLHYYNNIILRETHLYVLSVVITIILYLIFFWEMCLFTLDCWSIPLKREIVKKIFPVSIPLFPIFIMYLISQDIVELSLLTPLLQGILIGIGVLYLLIAFRNHLEKLAIIPIEVEGFLLHTYGGIPILRRAISSQSEKIIALASSLVAAIIGLGSAIEKKTYPHIFQIHRIVKTKMVMFFGKFVVGTFIVRRDSLALRDILKKIVHEYEKNVEYIDEGMITDSYIGIANKVFTKYTRFIQ